uniref:G-protein coupled receptors family 1 profile domain-containing protein n=1 Tax=Cricetulus griseus TaxID=10029 RepID=A0A8C2MCL3_CRIGR
SLTPASFILNGIPGLEEVHLWISFPLFTMYSIALTGNFGLMYLIYSEEVLHKPMYIFLALLSFTDVLMCTSTLPNTLCILWLNLKEIDFKTCLAQMFFVHTFTGMESGVLMLMAGMLTFLRGVILVIPFTFLTKRLPYCRGNVIPHTYCDHMSVAKISCGNVQINAIYGLMVALLIGGFDILCITVSYTMILRAVVSLSSADARQKAFSTCTAHISAIVITYVPAFFTFFTHRFGRHTIPPHIHIIMANLYLLMPPTMNPIVYGVKTKQIRETVIRFLFKGK